MINNLLISLFIAYIICVLVILYIFYKVITDPSSVRQFLNDKKGIENYKKLMAHETYEQILIGIFVAIFWPLLLLYDKLMK